MIAKILLIVSVRYVIAENLKYSMKMTRFNGIPQSI